MTITTTRGPMTRSRRNALRVVVVVTLLALLAVLGPVLVLAVGFWLPTATLAIVFPEDEIRIHLMHGVGFSVILWTILLGIGLQLRNPERSVAPMWVAVAYMAGGLALDLLTGVFELMFLPFYILVGLVFVLHPRRTAPLGRIHRPTFWAAALGSVPLLVYAYDELRLQLGGIAEDAHAAAGHYSTMAMLAVIIILGAGLGSTEMPGREVTARVAGASAVLLGVASLVRPEFASSLASVWAVAAIAWGAAYLVVADRRGAAVDSSPGPA